MALRMNGRALCVFHIQRLAGLLMKKEVTGMEYSARKAMEEQYLDNVKMIFERHICDALSSPPGTEDSLLLLHEAFSNENGPQVKALTDTLFGDSLRTAREAYNQRSKTTRSLALSASRSTTGAVSRATNAQSGNHGGRGRFARGGRGPVGRQGPGGGRPGRGGTEI